MRMMKFKHWVTGADVYVRPSEFNGMCVGGGNNIVEDGKTRLAVSILVNPIPGFIPISDTIESVRAQLTKNSIAIDDPTPLPAGS